MWAFRCQGVTRLPNPGEIRIDRAGRSTEPMRRYAGIPFAPHEVFSQVVAMVAGEDHDRALPQPISLHRLQQVINLRIDKGNTGMVGLHVLSTASFIVFPQFKPESTISMVEGKTRDIIEFSGRQAENRKALLWILVEVFLRRIERHMRFMNTAGNKEGPLSESTLVQPLFNPSHIHAIAMFFVGQLRGTEERRAARWFVLAVETAPGTLMWGLERTVFGQEFLFQSLLDRITLVLLVEGKLVPGTCPIIHLSMKHLANPGSPITICLKKFR